MIGLSSSRIYVNFIVMELELIMVIYILKFSLHSCFYSLFFFFNVEFGTLHRNLKLDIYIAHCSQRFHRSRIFSMLRYGIQGAVRCAVTRHTQSLHCRHFARSVMNWNEEKTLSLIELYKQRELLWNVKHVNHYNKKLKNEAWEEIADVLGSTGEELKRKMNALLSSLRREKCKMRRSEGKEKRKRQKEYALNEINTS